MSDRPVWIIVDTRTGKPATYQSVWLTEDTAWAEIHEWQQRHHRGGRPDITWDQLAHLAPRRRDD